MPNDGSLVRTERKGTPLLAGMRMSRASMTSEESIALFVHSVISSSYQGGIREHLLGYIPIGVYQLLDDNTWYFLVCDFDKESCFDNTRGYVATCREVGIPAYTEVSRSGNGPHVCIFFSEAVPSMEARQMGTRIISLTCDRIRQLSLTS